jgi:tetratricopeptide (TPR) repeat protein
MRRSLCQSVRLWFWVVLLAAAGCDRPESLPFAAETDEPNFRRGQQLVKTGREQEALAAYLKVIEKRGEDAPESHLEAGLIYQQHIKDPLAAIYYFRKYLELKPNSPQSELVRQRIDAATRDFARTLPAQPFESTMEKADLTELVDKLQRENNQLKEELAAARAAPPAGGAPSAAGETPAARDDNVPAAPAEVEPAVITIRTHPASPANRGAAAAGSRPPAGAVAAGRRHTVGPGDTLMKIAQHYYGSRSRWRDIFNANRDVMKSESSLKPGMELKIP